MDKIMTGVLIGAVVALIGTLVGGSYLVINRELRKQEVLDSCRAMKPLHECYTNIIMVN